MVSVSHEPVSPSERSQTDDDKRSKMLDTFLGTRYTVGKHFNSKLLLEYSVLVDELQNKLDLKHEMQVSYRISRSVYLRGSTEVLGNSQFSTERKAFIEKQWRFK